MVVKDKETIEKQEEVIQEQQNQEQQNQETSPLGKFKSVEELMKAYEEAQRKITELAERSKRAEELLEVYNATPFYGSSISNTPQQIQETVQKQDEDYYSKILDNPKEVFERFSKEVEQRILNKIQEERLKQLQAIQIYEYFYNKNPDLKGYEPIVGYFADMIQKQNPNESLEKILDMVAEKSRKYIAEKRLASSGGQPAIGVAEPQKAKVVKKTEEYEEYNPERELQQFLEERTKDKQKRLLIR